MTDTMAEYGRVNLGRVPKLTSELSKHLFTWPGLMNYGMGEVAAALACIIGGIVNHEIEAPHRARTLADLARLVSDTCLMMDANPSEAIQ